MFRSEIVNYKFITMKIYLKYFLCVPLWLTFNFSFACTIFTSSSGDAVFVGNNEDICTANSVIHIFPPGKDSFGRILWGFKAAGNYQGGMNEYGLFFDGAGTPPVKMTQPDLPAFKGDFVFGEALKKCKTVEEAINLVKKYRMPYLQFSHLLLADATGDAAIVEWGNDKLNFIRKDGRNYLIATNFNITESADPGK